ncbi:hypothetical protein L228DRAFT_247601 [Xylona heveae TC161]|uniref:Sodium/calcium exchanger membrane region domain-containing protein n=1 Tax=Xylona heveae (strain CBS 132557 / TC161) TaxID=1328760 RepID=A0A165GBK9_XYLHT|nr:hypothetical protein L228DRAFT_247601 [Xylona heveae TC161]KZF21991.1 hypothetical protein L228DRAFT_247601 [Xylona heveae TC161]
MNDSSDSPSLLDRLRSWAPSKAHASTSNSSNLPLPTLPVSNPTLPTPDHDGTTAHSHHNGHKDHYKGNESSTVNNVADGTSSTLPPPAPPPAGEDGGVTSSIESEPEKPNVLIRFVQASKEVLLSSWVNVLLVFVPVGIAVHFIPNMSPKVIFAMNAVAIIPLAGMLAHATESVASRMGDTVGALLNVTFGNAVELIIFIIALVKNEIRIVQASLLGSILANLLLILGMCFLFGGLRFREQIYNSTVTQMSACLLSLSVMSLLLPTAFHASFDDADLADHTVLQVSRGTSVVLLLVYVLYLLFQLKSHAYMYAGTPQHVIDEESHPGVLADIMGSSSSSSDSSDGSDSDESRASNTTAKRIRRALRGRRRRKSSTSSKDAHSMPSTARTPSAGTIANVFDSPESTTAEARSDRRLSTTNQHHQHSHQLGAIASGDEADTDGENDGRRQRNGTINFRDFEKEKQETKSQDHQRKRARKEKKIKKREAREEPTEKAEPPAEKKTLVSRVVSEATQPTPAFIGPLPATTGASPRLAFNMRTMSGRPGMPRLVSNNAFASADPSGSALPGTSNPRTAFGLRRTNSLPDRLNQGVGMPALPAPGLPFGLPVTDTALSAEDRPVKHTMSRTAAILLLLVSTALVALCAEFLVDSIQDFVEDSSISEAFIGLIILPIVGNAAEHVTAVTVASKNKMDLAIGVSVGSSIQIALFVTPLVVLLGWILQKDMSLYFNLFETISLFVSAFIVNFLVLDGRSNYLEGALLIAAYVIIAVSAFFYPNSTEQSVVGGSSGA